MHLDSYKVELGDILIPHIGICSLLDLGSLDPSKRSYTNMLVTAQVLILDEFGDISEDQLHLIFNELSKRFDCNITIILSGQTESIKNTYPTNYLTTLKLVYNKESEDENRVTMNIDATQADEVYIFEENEIVICLFRNIKHNYPC